MKKDPFPLLRCAILLPIALYSSNGLLFELYDRSQPSRRHYIVWERLKSTDEPPVMRLSATSIRD